MIDNTVVIQFIRDKLNQDHNTRPEFPIIIEKLTPVELALMSFVWSGGYIEACEDCGYISAATRENLILERNEILNQDLKKGGLNYD